MERTMQLDQALESIDAHGVFLCYDEHRGVELAPGRKLPIILRRSVFRYRSELENLMSNGDARVCPSKRLHRPYWRYNRSDKQYTCCKCLELDQDIRMIGEQQEPMAC